MPDDGFGARMFRQDVVNEGEDIDFDVTAVPATWNDQDGLDQATLTNTVLAQFACDDTLDRTYEQISEKTMSLAEFKTMYEHGSNSVVREDALRLLKKKIRLEIPDTMKYPNNHKDIVFSNTGVRRVSVKPFMFPTSSYPARCTWTSVRCWGTDVGSTRCSLFHEQHYRLLSLCYSPISFIPRLLSPDESATD